jgi:pyrroloquinoline quinone (PQQ) biosynthesis protein C
VYWEIWCYQPITTKAGFAMIGSMGPTERKVMKSLLMHKWEEVEHVLWALDGYKALGGDQSRIGNEAFFTSPGSFAVAAVWERLAAAVHPLAYLGAEFLFENLTARLTRLVNDALLKRGLSQQGMRFLVDHATEDERHSHLLEKLIGDVIERYPELSNQILYAFDCFHQVYPMPLWVGSYRRAQQLAGNEA